MVRVKICGIKRIEDAFSAIRWGADSIGFLVGQRHTSSDFITPEQARDMIVKLPPFVTKVLVTHLLKASEVLALADAVCATTIQLHGEIQPDQVRLLRQERPQLCLIKSLHVVDEASIEYGMPYHALVDAFILDSLNEETGEIGGTGLVHDWKISRRVVSRYPIPVILAGGLTPENIKDAIEIVKPYAVDVNSGLKDAKGFKDHAKVHAFIENAKRPYQG